MAATRKQPKRAAIYTRISDARDGDTAGVDRQREDCLALCEEKGWDVVAVHEDNNVSAMKRKVRPAYAELLNDVREKRCDVVVAWATDRLYRQPRDLEDLVDTLGKVPVVTVKSGEVDLSTSDGKTVARLLGAIAAGESEKRGERVARAAAQRAREGRYGGGRRRLGYTDKADALVPHEADEVRWAYEHVAAGGSLESVVRRWRQTLGTGPRGGQITGVQVRDVLLRPMNAGIAVYQEQEIGTTTLPTIIDEETWRTVRAILMDPSRRTTRGRPATSLLAPVLRCGVCDGRVSARNRLRRSNGKAVEGSIKDHIYACREGHVSKHRAKLDDAIGRLVVAWLQRHADGLTRPTSATASKAASKAVAEAEAHRKRLDDLATLLANGDLEAADYAAATREIRARLAAVEERIVTTTGRPQAAAMVRSGDIAAAWAAADDDVRRGVVKEIIDRITLTPGGYGPFTMNGVDIAWKD